jgi:glycosyltransferase involved in cell wall biosynthesis
MKFLYFHQHFSTPQGATGIRSYWMARRLIERGHQVTMVCGTYRGGRTGLDGPFNRGRRRGLVDGIDVIELELPYGNADGFARRTLTFLKFAWRSVGIALAEPYDLVFATTTPLTAGVPGIFARWLRRKPFVFEVRDLWPELPKAMGVIRNRFVLAAMSALEWVSYRSATRCIGLAPGIVNGIARRGVPRDRIAFISNGCDFEIFDGKASAWRPDRVSDDSLLAVFTGTHGAANGLDRVLDAAAVLQKRGRTDIAIALVGDGRLKPALQERATRDGLANVRFTAPVEKTKLAGLLASADVGLQILANVPAFYDGTSPNKFFDYIAAGLPVAINYPGWLAEQIVAEGCGFAIPPDNAEAFADALEAAADDRTRLAAMGQKGSALAHRSFDRAVLADQFVTFLEGAARR